MKTFKLLRNIFLPLLLMVTAGSCKKSFIDDVTSPSRIPVNGYYTNQAAFNAAVTGIYSTLRDRYDKFFYMAEVPSDNIEVPIGNAANTLNFDRFTYNATDSQVQAAYLGYYTTIACCNNFLSQIDAFNMDAVLKSRWIGEVKFIRAMMYFDLVRFFGNIPMPLTPIANDADAYTYPQVGPQKVYNQIIADLKVAESSLPANYTTTGAAASGAVYTSADIGRVTSGAAKAMLGKVYLTTGDYANAAAKLKELIPGSSGATSQTPLFGYTLLTNYASVFSPTNKNNAEIIFSIQYTSGVYNEGSNFAYYLYPKTTPVSFLNYLTPQSLGIATPDLVKAFEANDSRKAISVTNAGPTPGTTITTYYTRKYEEQPLALNQGNTNWIILRYSDVLLMEAEASAQLGDNTTALTCLNQVRTRARNGQAATVVPNKIFTTQAQLLADIAHERRVELCFEGQRWFDLLRSGSTNLITTMTNEFAADGFAAYTGSITADKMLFPIPFRETSLNPSYVQNPGY